MSDRESLAIAARQAIGGHKFIVVSNRQPFVAAEKNGKPIWVAPAGGLTAALTPIVSAVGGTWLAHGTAGNQRFTPSLSGQHSGSSGNRKFGVRLVRVPELLHDAYYEGLANQALWPLCHNVYQRPVYRDTDWAAYKRVNQLFADAVLDEAGRDPAVVFIQDYHLALVPKLIKRKNPRLLVAHFWHIPWPAPELLAAFPWADELIEGMLGNDVIGFHLDTYSRNFLDSADVAAGARADFEADEVRSFDHKTRVRSAPVSIDFQQHTETARSAAVQTQMALWQERLGNVPCVGVGIDRCDYTKGIPERLRAVGKLLELNPGLRGRFSFVQIAVPSRSAIPAYANLTDEVEHEAASINERFGTTDWKPVLLEQRNLPPVEMMALHRLASFCMVTPLHDGMNLVAKEFVASRFDNDGVLILSRFAGAARELTSAVQVNPFSETSLLSGIVSAMTMPASERQRRMSEARRAVSNNNIYDWAASLIQEFGSAIDSVQDTHRANLYRNVVASVA